MKSAVNQRRKLTTAPVVTPARVVKERAPLPTASVMSRPYDSIAVVTAQSSGCCRSTFVADPAFMKLVKNSGKAIPKMTYPVADPPGRLVSGLREIPPVALC
jgi:hypothetical protein